ncbi:MAG: hypothetical protein VYA30_09190 [Myxococcota bacterium]|nr:hypothetical protein [Myxococcota bacterium]
MRCTTTALIFALLSGCGVNLGEQVLSRPPLHPLLDTQTWLPKTDGPTVHFPRSVSSNTKQSQLRIKLNLKQLNPSKYRTLEHELKFIRAAYHGTAVRHRLGRVYSVAQLKATGRPVRRNLQVGDIVFFGQTGTPRIAVVKHIERDGTLQADALTRSKKRTIKINLTYRSKRRHQQRIVNSFIKKKDPGDSARSLYLAGQLVVAARRYLDD